jgi:hypothetical protein
MAGQVEIFNRALLKLGSGPVTGVNDKGVPGTTMNSLWNTVRQATLRRAWWSFALRRALLPALAAAPAWGFKYAYQLPSDFLRLVQANDYFLRPSMDDYRDSDDSPYAIEGKTLLTDFPAPLKVRYVADVTDPGAFDALFVEALASKLAYEGCERITQSNEKKSTAAQDFKMAMAEALKVGAIEKPPQGIVDDSWMLARL